MTFEVDIEPIGRRIPCKSGDTILDSAQKAGIMLNSICGGDGTCGRCIVRVMNGQVSSPNSTEEAELGEKVSNGWRLACQVEVLGDIKIHVPPDSLATTQRMQTEGRSAPLQLDPAVQAVTVSLQPPSLADLRSDAERLRDALGLPALYFPISVLRTLSNDLRKNEFSVNLFLRGSCVVAVRPANISALGLAVDLGTTKLAAYLVDLASGETLATSGSMNPQIAFGEDVMARIAHALSKPAGGEQLRSVIVQALSEMADDLCAKTGLQTANIADGVIVGNTAMHHLFLGLPVRQLGLAPYIAAESASLDIPANEIGFNFAPGANIHLLPNIAGFVGSDHVAMLLGSGMLEKSGVVLGLDIGTNTEISLIANGKHYACSTASGPAFEGAHILHGMRAGPGAIEKVLIRGSEIMLQTIDDKPPVGLCGSGILDLIAQMYKADIINSRGALNASIKNARIRKGDHGMEFVLVAAGDRGEREVTFSRSDVNEIQLAKGAMRSGVKILLEKAGLTEQDIDAVFLAGAFGTYLDVQSGIDIGMLPKIEKEKFFQVGNAAGTGARMALLSNGIRAKALQMAKQINYVELTIEPSFSSIFAKSLMIQ
jgi:uncharacterized 2Fe-2S/4Fe-4S cluster protein (DUF4445 family)